MKFFLCLERKALKIALSVQIEKCAKYLQRQYIPIYSIYLWMKVYPLTSISSPAPEIGPNVLLTGDVFYAERVFLYHHGPMEHTVILVGSILQVFQGFMISLECESLAT